MKKTKDAKEQRKQYQIRLHDEERSKIEEAALRDGAPAATWIRMKAIQAANAKLATK